MIVYRCTACTHDHKTLNVQGLSMTDPTCERCGGSSFAQIHLPDEPVDGKNLADPGVNVDGKNLAAGPELAAFDAAPPTPRDAPTNPEHERERDKLRGVGVDKAPGLCSQVDCHQKATHRFTWPGNPESFACPKHARAATNLASVMGFFLEVPAL